MLVQLPDGTLVRREKRGRPRSLSPSRRALRQRLRRAGLPSGVLTPVSIWQEQQLKQRGQPVPADPVAVTNSLGSISLLPQDATKVKSADLAGSPVVFYGVDRI